MPEQPRGPSLLRRGAEAGLAGVLLLALAPVLILAAVGIVLSSPGPVLYLARRSGLGGTVFEMYKFRTMRLRMKHGSRITGANDSRIFPFGALLRKLKIDELPQLLNIIRGEMAFVGPRPEDPYFVEHCYTPPQRETLLVLPGLTSPGSLYYYEHAEQFLDDGDPEAAYLSGPLAHKLELDRRYVYEATLARDIRLVLRTVQVLALVALGRRGSIANI